MSAELAVAYVSLAISSRDHIADDVRKQLGAVGEKADQSGKKIGDGLLAGIGKTLKVGAVAVGGLAVAGIGTALVKGFERLDSLDKATAKLTGLGHSGETVRAIMDNALASVKGTAFGMGEAATVAAGAVAAQIKPGKDLQRTLKLVADAATIAGTDMASMGSIFNKVAASGKLQGDVIAQLQDAGVPVLQFVAKQMGVTAGEAAKLASQGKVSFETFQDAMESGLGGAALSSGDTFSGAMSNVLAALGRVGANLLGGIFPMMRDGLGDIQTMLEPMEAGAKKVGEAIGAVVSLLVSGDFTSAIRDALQVEEDSPLIEFLLGLRSVVLDVFTVATQSLQAFGNAFSSGESDIAASGLPGFFDSLGVAARGFFDWAGDNISLLKAFAVGFGVLTGAILVYRGVMAVATGVQWALNAAMTANPVGLIIAAIAALVAAIWWVATETTFFQDTWANLTKGISMAWGWLVGVFDGATKAIGGALTSVYEGVIKPVVNGVVTVFRTLYEQGIKPVVDAIAAAFRWVFETIIQPLVTSFWTNFGVGMAIIQAIYEGVLRPALEGIGALFSWLWLNAIQPTINAIVAAVTWVGDALTWLWTTVVTGVANGIAAAVQGIGQVFGWLQSNIIAPVTNAISVALNWVGGVFANFYRGMVKPALDGVGAAMQWVYNSVIKPVTDWISNAMNAVGSTISSVFGGMASFVGNAFQSLVGVIKGPINAVIGLVNGAIRGLNNVSVTIPDWVPEVGGQRFGVSIPSIPRLAEGGIVSRSRGGSIVNVGEGRYSEAVIPLGGPQFAALADALTDRMGAGNGGRMTLVVGGREFDAYVSEQADARIGVSDRVSSRTVRAGRR